MATPHVSIYIAAKRDLAQAKKAMALLDALGVTAGINLVSPDRTRDRLEELVKGSTAKVFIAIAGEAAALPGAIAALTMRPIIGVPVAGPHPQDTLFAMTQAAAGNAVAWVGTDRPEDAALLAAAMLALCDEKVQSALAAHRERQRQAILDADRELQGALRR